MPVLKRAPARASRHFTQDASFLRFSSQSHFKRWRFARGRAAGQRGRPAHRMGSGTASGCFEMRRTSSGMSRPIGTTACLAPKRAWRAHRRTWLGARYGDGSVSDSAGRLTEICQRDNARERYLTPEIIVSASCSKAAVPPGSRCIWNFDDGTIPPEQVTVGCDEEVRVRVRYGKPPSPASASPRRTAAFRRRRPKSP